MKATGKVSVVIPTYNSHRSHRVLVERILEVLTPLGFATEVLFVDDASPNPSTWESLRTLHADFPTVVRCLRLAKNAGQHAATLCGLELATGDWVVTMDDDMQHRPQDLQPLLALREHDVVIARFRNKKHSLFKRLTSSIKGVFDRIILQVPPGIRLTSYRLLSRQVVEHLLQVRTPFPFIPAQILQVTQDVVNVEIQHAPRTEGRSGYSLPRLIRLFSNLLINNSSLMLKAIGSGGIVMSTIALGVGIYYTVVRLSGRISLGGWTSTIVTILFLGGLILFGLGVIGEYLLRIIATLEHPRSFYVRDDSDRFPASQSDGSV